LSPAGIIGLTLAENANRMLFRQPINVFEMMPDDNPLSFLLNYRLRNREQPQKPKRPSSLFDG
jgi:hypothetical protein